MKPHVEKLKRLGACQEAVEWAAKFPSGQAAWDACERPDWMAWYISWSITKRGSRAHRKLVGVIARCVRPVLKYVPKSEKRPKRALDLATRWSHGDRTVTVEMLRGACCDSYIAMNVVIDAAAAEASHAAADVAYYADYVADDTHAYIIDAVIYAANAAAYAYIADAVRNDGYIIVCNARTTTNRRMCRVIRRAYPKPPRIRKIGA